MYKGKTDLEQRLNAKECELCGDNHKAEKNISCM